MLVIRRKKDEELTITNNKELICTIKVIKGSAVLGFEAGNNILILRKELESR